MSAACRHRADLPDVVSAPGRLQQLGVGWIAKLIFNFYQMSRSLPSVEATRHMNQLRKLKFIPLLARGDEVTRFVSLAEHTVFFPSTGAGTKSFTIGAKLGPAAAESFNRFSSHMFIIDPALTDNDDVQVRGTVHMSLKKLGVQDLTDKIVAERFVIGRLASPKIESEPRDQCS